MIIRNADINDAGRIFELISHYASKGMMLPKTLYRIYSKIESFIVIEKDCTIIGCVSVAVLWKDMAEIRSLAVDKDYVGHGLGRKLIEACIEKAVALKIPKLIALTYQKEFFEKLGFKFVNKNMFQIKMLVDCLDCPKLESCDELAYMYEL